MNANYLFIHINWIKDQWNLHAMYICIIIVKWFKSKKINYKYWRMIIIINYLLPCEIFTIFFSNYKKYNQTKL